MVHKEMEDIIKKENLKNYTSLSMHTGNEGNIKEM